MPLGLVSESGSAAANQGLHLPGSQWKDFPPLFTLFLLGGATAHKPQLMCTATDVRRLKSRLTYQTEPPTFDTTSINHAFDYSFF